MAGENPLSDPFGHSLDNDAFHFPAGREWDVYTWSHGWMGDALGFLGIHGLTKFMFLELIAAGICLLIFVPYALSIRVHGYAKGRWANLIESMLVFIREEVAIPALGEHGAHKFLPYLWSVFFFILVNNLLGIIPWMGSATGALGCTTALALCSFVMIHVSGMWELGVGHYLASITPHAPWAIRYILLLPIEIIGHIIRPSVLAFRLFVNMLAGHTVLFVLSSFIAVIGPGFLYFVVTPASLFGVFAVSLLELLVAFIQAFVFTFLSAVFIGGAVHPEH